MDKYTNILVNCLSLLFSVVTRKPYLWGYPPAVGVEISAFCNLRCPECPSGTDELKRPRGFMSPALFSELLDEVKPFLFNINLYFQGESMLHPDFFTFTGYARGVTITLATNGHYLSDETIEKLVRSGVRKVIIPLDGTDQQTYGLYRRGGDFEKVTGSIRRLSSAIRKSESRLQVEIQFLVNRFNMHQMKKAKEFARENRCRFKPKSMQILSGEYEKWLPEDKRFRRYTPTEGGYSLKRKVKTTCFRLWMNPVITWDGEVIPCCFDKSAENSFGNIRTESFRKIWNGEKSIAFRQKLLYDRHKPEICKNCTTRFN